MPSYYEINVALNGHHYFATAPRSLTMRSQAEAMVKHFRTIFPPTFTITLTHWNCAGTSITVE